VCVHGSNQSKTASYKHVTHSYILQALCSERFRDWTAKFEGLGIKCMLSFPLQSWVMSDLNIGCELTGDTVFTGQNVWKDAQAARIM
jgi:ATP-dependent DNA helicase HFM1/MER3